MSISLSFRRLFDLVALSSGIFRIFRLRFFFCFHLAASFFQHRFFLMRLSSRVLLPVCLLCDYHDYLCFVVKLCKFCGRHHFGDFCIAFKFSVFRRECQLLGTISMVYHSGIMENLALFVANVTFKLTTNTTFKLTFKIQFLLYRIVAQNITRKD